MARLAAAHGPWLDAMVEHLLAWNENVVGCRSGGTVPTSPSSSRRVKARRPSAHVVLGGPEAIDGPMELDDPRLDQTAPWPKAFHDARNTSSP